MESEGGGGGGGSLGGAETLNFSTRDHWMEKELKKGISIMGRYLALAGGMERSGDGKGIGGGKTGGLSYCLGS